MMVHMSLEMFRKHTKNMMKKCTKSKAKNYAKAINRDKKQENRIDGYKKKVYDMNCRNNTKLFGTEDEGNEKKSSCGAAGGAYDLRDGSDRADRLREQRRWR